MKNVNTVTINLKGVDLEVSVYVEAPSRGAREPGTGMQLEPDVPEMISICAVMVDGSEQDIWALLSENVEEEIQKEVEEEIRFRGEL